MTKGLTIGVAGVTGVVGETALDILSDAEQMSGVPIESIRGYASKSSAGKMLQAGHYSIKVETLEHESLSDCDVVFFATDSALSKATIPALAEKGVLCIDNSSAFRMDPSVPLVVPEVNGDLLGSFPGLEARPIVANPNCCAAPLTVALNPLKKTFGIERVIVSTYQSVSGAGKQAVDLLLEQSRDFLASPDPRSLPKSAIFPKPIAFNVFPFVASIDSMGHTDEERKIVEETRKILNLSNLPLAATSVRVPTFVSHGESVTVELSKNTTREQLVEVLKSAPGLVLLHGEEQLDWQTLDSSEGPRLFPTPREVHGKDPVYIGRVRQVNAFQEGRGFSFWLVSDNLRKGAALNGVQILKSALRIGLLDRLRAKRS